MRKQIVIGLAVVAMLSACQKEEAQQPAASAPTMGEAQPTAPASATGLFESAPPALSGKAVVPGGKGNIELFNKSKIDKVVKVTGNSQIELEGWAVDVSGKTVPETVIVQFAPTKGGAEFYAAATRINKPRPDIASFFKEPAFKSAAFSVTTNVGSLPTGEYNVKIIQVAGNDAYVSGPYARIQKGE